MAAGKKGSVAKLRRAQRFAVWGKEDYAQSDLADAVRNPVPLPKTRSNRGTSDWQNKPVTRKDLVAKAKEDARDGYARKNVAQKALKHAVGLPALTGADILVRGQWEKETGTHMAQRLAKDAAKIAKDAAQGSKQLARIEGLKKARKTDFGQNVGTGRPARPKMYEKKK